MDVETKPLTDKDYNDLLIIESEQDLLITDPTTGESSYVFITEEDVRIFKEETEHLQRVIIYAIDQIKWCVRKKRALEWYGNIYKTIIKDFEEYTETIHRLHRKVYNTLYKNYTDEMMQFYTENLEKLLDEFKRMEIHKQEDFFWEIPVEGAEEIRNEIFNAMVEKLKIPIDQIKDLQTMSLKEIAWNVTMINIKLSMKAISIIETSLSALYRTLVFRKAKEDAIIYDYLKKEFEEKRQKAILEDFTSEQRRYRKDRMMQLDSKYLNKLLDETEQKHNNSTACKTWFDERESAEDYDEIEELAYKLSRSQLSKNQIDLMFEYRSKHKMIKNMIASVREYERNGDPMFALWVDPFKLEDYLKPWIKANITTQEKWYIVWCLMKYTFEMIREGIDKNDFAARMKEMFPKAEKKCVVESFRKKETQLDHNRHFSKWRDDDPDYLIAQSLYEKMKNKNAYNRNISF